MAKNVPRLVERVNAATSLEEAQQIVRAFSEDGRKRVTSSIRRQILAGKRRGWSAMTIRTWLIGKGVRLSPPTIRQVLREEGA